MTGDLFNAAEGQRRAEEGQAVVAANHKRAVAELADEFLAHLRSIAPEPGSMDTLRATGYTPPADAHRNSIGAAIARLSRAGLIECVGVARSERASMQAGKLYLWKLADGGGA
jgi:hypothetical protein